MDTIGDILQFKHEGLGKMCYEELLEIESGNINYVTTYKDEKDYMLWIKPSEVIMNVTTTMRRSISQLENI